MTQSINQVIAQLAHTAIGALFVLTPVALWPYNPLYIIYSVALILGVDIVKEMTYDLKYEQGETVKTGLVDWSFYILGSWLAFLLLFFIRPGVL